MRSGSISLTTHSATFSTQGLRISGSIFAWSTPRVVRIFSRTLTPVLFGELIRYDGLGIDFHIPIGRRSTSSQMCRLIILFTCLCVGEIHISSAQEVFSNSLGMKLKLIPAGEFRMGSPKSEPHRRDHELQRLVTISRPFYLATTEVTQEQWKKVMGTEPWSERPYVREGNDYAASCISWTDATEFCRKLGSQEGRTYRLPTEAEWEYACRAGTKTAFSYGSDATKMTEYGWIGSNSFDIGQRYAHRVAQKKPNPFGLHDMHGNNWEWCSDWYSEPTSETTIEPGGPATGQKRVIRGGSWHGLAKLCRSASRFKRGPTSQLNDLGFRVALETKDPE
jgi:sulfatase modifying factor 1